MNNQNEKGFHPVYILAGLYTFAIYMFPVICFVVNRKVENENSLQMWPLGLLIIWGMINLLVVFRFKDKISRIRLLNCAILIKYTLIPFYFVGSLAIAIALLLMFTPVVIMAFVGPAMC